MSDIRWKLASILVIFSLVAFGFSCVDNSEVVDSPGGEVGPEETEEIAQCGDAETINPQTGACVAVDANTSEPENGEEEPGNGGESNDSEEPVNGGEEPVVTDCGFGEIRGMACMPNGNRLPAAQIRIAGQDCHGAAFERVVESDSDGLYVLDEVPAGSYQLSVSSGSFSGARTVEVVGGELLDLTGDADKVCVQGGEVKMMVLDGSNDDIAGILSGLGLTYETTPNYEVCDFLSNLPALLEQDIVFIECGTAYCFESGEVGYGLLRAEIVDNLRAFVQQGGSLYVSDLAWNFVSQPFPDMASFYGTGTMGNVLASVMSATMQALLPAGFAEIYFDMGGWRIVESVDMSTVIHFEADVPVNGGTLQDIPIMISNTDPILEGTVFYTSFHNSAQASDMIGEILDFMIFQL